jgi:hypothetical protein
MRTALVLLLLGLVLAAVSHAAAVDAGFPAFAGLRQSATCNASATWDDTLYLAGHIRWAGPLTGGGVIVQGSDLVAIPGSPRVNGQVLAAAADGAGGWYIGGLFTHVGGAARANLAHILADLSVDAWAPTTNGSVLAIAVSAENVYFSGTFSTVNGVTHSALAGVSRGSGATLPLDPNPGGVVQALAIDGGTLYVGGEFTNIAGQPRGRMAAFRITDHALLPWDPAASGSLTPTGTYALKVANGVVYAGGNFSSIQGQPRRGVAALDPLSGAPRAWDPGLTGTISYGVRSILPAADRIYLGGDFAGLQGSTRHSLAAVDTSTGTLLTWDPNAALVSGSDAQIASVNCLELDGTSILAGGTFDVVGGAPHENLARLDPVTGAPAADAPQTPHETRTLAVSGANVLFGGRYSTLAQNHCGDLVAVRVSTGELLPWSPDATHDTIESSFGTLFFHSSQVDAIAVDATRVYVAASFYDPFGGVNRSIIKAFSRSSGSALWSVEPYGDVVRALAVVNTLVIAGGSFSPPSPSGGLMALDAESGAGVAWGVPTSGGPVLTLLPTPVGLAVGGVFTTAGGQPRSKLALLDPGTGLATSWDPGANGGVWSLAVAGSTLFCGGDFTTAGGQPRSGIAAIDLATGAATAWNPGASGSVRGLAFDQGIVYAVGAFTTIAGAPRVGLAALNSATGDALPWDAGIQNGHIVLTVEAGGGRVLAGGTQLVTGSDPTEGFSPVMAPDALLGVPGWPGTGARLALRVEPQPMHAAGRVRFQLREAADVEVALFDIAGRRVATLDPPRHRDAGEYSIVLAPARLRPGAYLVRVSTRAENVAARVVILE